MPESSGDLVIRGGTVVTMDASGRVLRDGEVLVRGGEIAAVGSALEAPAGARVLDAGDGLVMPGLIQGHLHLGQTLFRGLAEGRRLLPWLRERIWPLEAAHDDESAYWSALLGAAECLLGGTTTIQEIGLGPGAAGLLRGIRESGLRAQAGMCLMDSGEGMPTGLPGETEAVLAETESLGDGFDGAEGGRLQYLLNPRFILSCSDPLWRGIVHLSEARGWAIHTHALEQREEMEAVRELKSGRDEIEYFDDVGVLAGDLRIAHGVWLERDHLRRVDRDHFSVVHCPSSNLKLGSGIANIVRIREAGIAVGIGADGAPCNNSLDAFEELRLAALLQALRHGPGVFSGRDALRLATSEGARVLGLEKRVGSLEPGKAADLVVLSTQRPELWAGAVDPHDLIAFSASPAAVRHVMVEGELLVEDGRLTRLDYGEIRRRADQSLAALLGRSGLEH